MNKKIIVLFLLLIIIFSSNMVYSELTPTSNCMGQVDKNTNCVEVIVGIFPNEKIGSSSLAEEDSISIPKVTSTDNIAGKDIYATENKLYEVRYYEITSSDQLNELDQMIQNGEIKIVWDNYNKKYCTYRSNNAWTAYAHILRKYADSDGHEKKDEKTYTTPTNFVCEDTIAPRMKVAIKSTNGQLPKVPGDKFLLSINVTDDENALLYDENQNDESYLKIYSIELKDANNKLIEKIGEGTTKKELSKILSNIEIDPLLCQNDCNLIFNGEDNIGNKNESYKYSLPKRYLSLDKDGFCSEKNLCYYGGENTNEYTFIYDENGNLNSPECVKPGEKINGNYCSNYGWISKTELALSQILNYLENKNYEDVRVYCNSYDKVLNTKCDDCESSCIIAGYKNNDYSVFYTQNYNKYENGVLLNDILKEITGYEIVSGDVSSCEENNNILNCNGKNFKLLYDKKNDLLIYNGNSDFNYDVNANIKYFKSKFEVFDYFKEKLKEYYNEKNPTSLKLKENSIIFTKNFSYKKNKNGREMIGSIVYLKNVHDETVGPFIILYYKNFDSEEKNLIYKILTESRINPEFKLKDILKYEDDDNLLIISSTSEDVASEQLERFIVRLR